jgi:hypothetical protein
MTPEETHIDIDQDREQSARQIESTNSQWNNTHKQLGSITVMQLDNTQRTHDWDIPIPHSKVDDMRKGSVQKRPSQCTRNDQKTMSFLRI